MKFLPAAAILIVSVAMGQILGRTLAEGDNVVDESFSEAPGRDEIHRIAKAHALELIRARVAELESNDTMSKEEKARKLSSLLSDLSKGLREMDDIMARTEEVVGGLSASLGAGLEPGERVVVTQTARQLNNKLVLGRNLIGASQLSVRREGLRLLAEAVAEGHKEALDLIIASISDSDKSFAREAMRRATTLARSESPAVVAMVKDSILESQLIGVLPTLTGGDQTRALQALTALKNPAAIQGWREIYTKDGGSARNRIAAAQSLKKLGSPQEYDQMLSSFRTDLASQEGRASRTAISNLGRLGGDEAKVALKNALDADPTGQNARRIERALRQIERGSRTNNRFGGGGRRRGF